MLSIDKFLSGFLRSVLSGASELFGLSVSPRTCKRGELEKWNDRICRADWSFKERQNMRMLQ